MTSQRSKAGPKSQTDRREDGRFASFLFDADHKHLKNGNYATPCEAALLDAMAQSGAAIAYPIRVLRGDVLPHELAKRLHRLNIPIKTGKYRTVSREMRTDRDAVRTVIGDLCDSLRDGASTVDLVELPGMFGRGNIFCLTLSPMNAAALELIDAHLKKFAPYLGAVDLEAGNPVHVELFVDHLLDCVWLDSGVVYASRWDTDEGVYDFGDTPSKAFRLIEQPWVEFRQMAPPRPRVEALSDRGAASARRISSVSTSTHLEQVANRLSHARMSSSPQYPVDLTITYPAEEQMVVPIRKLLDYALNESHPTGKHKALLFSELMGITKADWRFLAFQIRNNLTSARLEKVSTTEHGIKYGARMEITGLNGKVMTIETGWIIRANEPAQLTTAYVADKKHQQDGKASFVPWAAAELQGSDRFAEIYRLADLAGEEAASNCVPTPMRIIGYEVEMEGECGGAYVRLDGRSKFGRWLKANELASSSYLSGVSIYAKTNSQSADRAKAYAEAFAHVLWLNGIDGAQVETYPS